MKKILSEKRKIVFDEVKKYLENPKYPNYFRVPLKYSRMDKFHWKMVSDYPRRMGKYLRPTILLLTTEALGANPKKAIKTATAMQLSEDWLLIHDDFQDKSDFRRGKQTLPKLYGDELAVNAGDCLHLIMWKVLIDNEKILGKDITFKLMNEFYSALSRTSLGQTVELKWVLENKKKISDQDYFFLVNGKTSYYTVALPLRLGAIIAGAKKRELELLTKFSLSLGRCFQITDDILDLTTDFSGLKAQRGNDIFEGKRTVIVGHLLRKVSSKQRKKILAILGKGRSKKTKEEVEWVIQKMHQLGSIDYALSLANELASKALEEFDKELKFLSFEPARSYLREIIIFVLERTY